MSPTPSTEVAGPGEPSSCPSYGPLAKIRPRGVSPRLRPHLPSQTRSHDVLPLGHATSTCCATVSALGVSHPLGGSSLGWLVHVAALPDEIRSVSHCCRSPAMPRDTARASGLPPPSRSPAPASETQRSSKRSHPSKNPFLRQQGRLTPTNRSSASRLDHLAAVPLPSVTLRAAGAVFAPPCREEHARLRGVTPSDEPSLGGTLLLRAETLSFHGFLVPLRGLLPASADSLTPVRSSIPLPHPRGLGCVCPAAGFLHRER